MNTVSDMHPIDECLALVSEIEGLANQTVRTPPALFDTTARLRELLRLYVTTTAAPGRSDTPKELYELEAHVPEIECGDQCVRHAKGCDGFCDHYVG